MPGISRRDQVSARWMPVSQLTGFAHEVLPGDPGTGAGVPAAAVLAGMVLFHRGLRCKLHSARRARGRCQGADLRWVADAYQRRVRVVSR